MAQPTGILAPHHAAQWSRRDATHFLWRTQFGAATAEITRVHREGLAKSLERVLTPQPEDDEFQTVEPILRDTALDTGSVAGLQTWWLHRMFYSANPLTERMALLWHNHFATSFAKVRSAPHMLAQNDAFRTEALGSFRRLLHTMSKDVAMLIWLDGNANRKRHANENFAREVMELFSLGEGNYTEDDIKQAARAFTGWHVRDDEYWFNARQHDNTDKRLFGKTANLDGDDVIDLCLAHRACARFIALKLLREFVLDAPTEAQIDAVAARVREHEFAMAPVLRELLGSKLFFSAEARHARIKGPVELILGACRALAVRPNLQAVNQLAGQLGQSLFEPPTVKGWEGGRLWITSASLLQRNNFVHRLLNGGLGKLPEPQGEPDHFRELLLARAEPGLAAKAASTRQQVHLMMTLPEFQLT